MKGRFLVDTNVLVYATLTNDYRNKEALAVLELRHQWSNQLFISAQNLAEMYPVLTGPKTQPSDSPALARKKIKAFAMMNSCSVIPVTSRVVAKALEICEKYNITKQRFFDMQLVATMLLEGIPTIVTENTRDFDPIEEITAVNPFED